MGTIFIHMSISSPIYLSLLPAGVVMLCAAWAVLAQRAYPSNSNLCTTPQQGRPQRGLRERIWKGDLKRPEGGDMLGRFERAEGGDVRGRFVEGRWERSEREIIRGARGRPREKEIWKSRAGRSEQVDICKREKPVYKKQGRSLFHNSRNWRIYGCKISICYLKFYQHILR